MEQEEVLENDVRSKIERRTSNKILTVLDFTLHDELLGKSEERHRPKGQKLLYKGRLHRMSNKQNNM
jgi:hypothetical protein